MPNLIVLKKKSQTGVLGYCFFVAYRHMEKGVYIERLTAHRHRLCGVAGMKHI